MVVDFGVLKVGGMV